MLISETELEELIKEEIERAIDEGWLDRMIAKGSGLKSRMGGALSGLGAKAARGLGADTAAAEMEKAGATRTAAAPNQEKLGLMKQHSRKFSIVSTDMIKDAQKLGLLEDPNFKKALAAAKAVATRMNNIVAAWEKAPEQIPGGEGAAGAVPEVTAVNQNNLATRDADNYGDDRKLNAKGLQLAKAQVAFLNKQGKNVPDLLSKAIQDAEAGSQENIPTQVVPKDDLDAEVAARQAAGSPPVREALKKIIREELQRMAS